MAMYIMIGEPGSGKSTIAASIAKAAKAAVVSSDEIRKDLWGDETEQKNAKLVFDIAYDRCEDLLSDHCSVILDATNVRPEHRARYIELAHKHNVRAVAFVYSGSVSAAVERNNNRDRKVPEDVLRTMAEFRRDFPPSKAEGFDEIYRFYFGGIVIKR